MTRYLIAWLICRFFPLFADVPIWRVRVIPPRHGEVSRSGRRRHLGTLGPPRPVSVPWTSPEAYLRQDTPLSRR